MMRLRYFLHKNLAKYLAIIMRQEIISEYSVEEIRCVFDNFCQIFIKTYYVVGAH